MNCTIAEMRIYQIQAGRVGEYVAAYAQLGRETQIKHLGHPIGYFTSDIGGLNKIVHLWGYASMADRQERRQRLEADPAWKKYLAHRIQAGLLISQENNILNAVQFTALDSAATTPNNGEKQIFI
jgi:hypothetical protein